MNLKDQPLKTYRKTLNYIIFFFTTLVLTIALVVYANLMPELPSVLAVSFVFKAIIGQKIFQLFVILNIAIWGLLLFYLISRKTDVISTFAHVFYPLIGIQVFLIIIGVIPSPDITPYLNSLFEMNEQFNWDRFIYGLGFGLLLLALNILLVESIRFIQHLLSLIINETHKDTKKTEKTKVFQLSKYSFTHSSDL